MRISNTRQSNNRCGGETTKDDGPLLLLLLLGARGLEPIGDVFSLCWVMIRMTTHHIIQWMADIDIRHTQQPTKNSGRDNGG